MYICTPDASRSGPAVRKGLSSDAFAFSADGAAGKTSRSKDTRTLAGKQGLMAEWLGKGLQNLVQRFESASDLTETPL